MAEGKKIPVDEDSRRCEPRGGDAIRSATSSCRTRAMAGSCFGLCSFRIVIMPKFFWTVRVGRREFGECRMSGGRERSYSFGTQIGRYAARANDEGSNKRFRIVPLLE